MSSSDITFDPGRVPGRSFGNLRTACICMSAAIRGKQSGNWDGARTRFQDGLEALIQAVRIEYPADRELKRIGRILRAGCRNYTPGRDDHIEQAVRDLFARTAELEGFLD